MKRLLTALACDLRLHFRHGFHSAAILLGAASTLFLVSVPEPRRAALFPLLLVFNQLIIAFFFTARQVLIEKAEGSLIMIGVTPLRPHEYLASKVAAFGAASLVVNLGMVLLAGGTRARLIPLAAGIVAAGAMLTLAGFLVAASFRSMKGFLLPSLVFALALLPALLPEFGLQQPRWLVLHPLQAPLALIRSAFHPVPLWQSAYGAGYSLLWIGIALAACKRAFARIRSA